MFQATIAGKHQRAHMVEDSHSEKSTKSDNTTMEIRNDALSRLAKLKIRKGHQLARPDSPQQGVVL